MCQNTLFEETSQEQHVVAVLIDSSAVYSLISWPVLEPTPRADSCWSLCLGFNCSNRGYEIDVSLFDETGTVTLQEMSVSDDCLSTERYIGVPVLKFFINLKHEFKYPIYSAGNLWSSNFLDWISVHLGLTGSYEVDETEVIHIGNLKMCNEDSLVAG